MTAAVILRGGRYLVTRRPEGAHLAGLWEFPGGKVRPGEAMETALARELREELGIEAVVGAEVARKTHAYPEKTVHIHFFACRIVAGEPEPLEVAEVRWVPPPRLAALEFPPADAALIAELLREPYVEPG